MEKVVRQLKILFFLPLIVSLIVVILYESEILLPYSLLLDDGVSYVVLLLIELMTLAVVPLALYLFKMKSVRKQLDNDKEKGLLLFGCLRLSILGIMLIVNTVLYYLSGLNTSYGYLALLLLLVFPFVYPSRARCEAETENEGA